MKTMQHCFNCGAELGIYEKLRGDMDACGLAECQRAERDAYAAADEEAQERAREDNFDKYR